MSIRTLIILLAVLLLMDGCRAFNRENLPATYEYENIAYATEAFELQRTIEARQTEVEATAEAAGTFLANVNSVNTLLVATVRAGDAPTLAVVPGVVPESLQVTSVSGMDVNGLLAIGTPGTPVGFESTPAAGIGGAQYIQVATASSVRDSDSCAAVLQTDFPLNSQQIYISARGINVRQGTRLEVEWYYGSQLRLRDQWTLPEDADSYCFYFVVTPADMSFAAGQWSVQLYADGQPIDPRVTFTIAPQ